MKKFLRLLKPYTLRPLISSCFLKAVVGICAVLLWNRFVLLEASAISRGAADKLFVPAIWFLVWAWFQYLALDGMKIRVLWRFDGLQRKRRRHQNSHMADFAEEKIITFDDLTEEEQTAVKLCSDLIAGMLFLAGSLVGAFV